MSKYIVSKGSVCIDGVSLTINDVNKKKFCVNIIEHTQKTTTFKKVQVGDFLNIEIDMIARYVQNKLI